MFGFRKSKVEGSFSDDSSSSFSEWLFGRFSGGGDSVTAQAAMRESTAFRCTNLLSSSVAGLPLLVYKKGRNGDVVADNHKSFTLLHDAPNEYMTSFAFHELQMVWALLRGNSYAIIERNKAGRAVSLLPLSPDQVIKTEKLKNGLVYTVQVSEKKGVKIDHTDMLHVAGLGFDGITGISVIQAGAAGAAINHSQTLLKFSQKLHSNSAKPSGVLEVEDSLSPEALKNLKRGFDKMYSGDENAGNVMYLDKGMKFSVLSITPEDAQTLESRRYQACDIAKIFGVPPHMVGETDKSTSWGSGIEQQNIGFVQYSLKPWLKRFEQEYNRKLFAGTDHYCKFKLEGLLRGDSKTRAEFYSSGIQNGWMTPNDVRKLENMPTKKGADELFIQSNLAPINTMTGENKNVE